MDASFYIHLFEKSTGLSIEFWLAMAKLSCDRLEMLRVSKTGPCDSGRVLL